MDSISCLLDEGQMVDAVDVNVPRDGPSVVADDTGRDSGASSVQWGCAWEGAEVVLVRKLPNITSQLQ
jgi:hypothetical protein